MKALKVRAEESLQQDHGLTPDEVAVTTFLSRRLGDAIADPAHKPLVDLTRPRRPASWAGTTGVGMDELLVARRGGVHILTLNRPDKLNAFTFPLQAALMAALADAAADGDCRAVLLHGAGRGFCAGQDLTMVEAGVDLGDTLERSFNPLVRRLRALRLPVVCAVHGVAAGAGANLALACDIVLAGESARLHPVLRQDRPDPRRWRHMDPAPPSRRRPGTRDGAAGRAGHGGAGGGLGA